MKSNEKQDFLSSGIKATAGDIDKKLFNSLKEILFRSFTEGGHDYVPLPMEYRASSVAYCSRKTVLNKDPTKYLTEEEMQLLPDWFLLTLQKEIQEIPSKFGTNVAGQIIHEVIQEALKDEVISMEEEVKFEAGKFKLIGHYDLLLQLENGEKMVIDIKSTNTNREYLPAVPHLKQLMAYQGMLGGIRGALLYVHRNNWELSFVSQDFKKEKFTSIVMKLSQMAVFEEKGELPPAVPSLANECASERFKCQYYDYCYPISKPDDI
ncbi:MAG: PD-(D/E)XK nuclease family protein [Candidatus Kariarchaeaceae archaeon]|jgi:CRISPR/Cas system-associated exonuclease Cas4 (RecB family)